ncbi:MAG TPA: PP2C family protein-serine/threonine phosphatase [Candidatus Limnocylindrales bacterium]|nr:PP2C family protein-serine/threonine phosphatase [Candidatus Limnocylindrales bacterium]
MRPDAVTILGDHLDGEALAGLLALASAAADGAPVGLVDAEGRLVAGRSAGPVPARTHAVRLDDRVVGAVVGSDALTAELLALVARSLELILAGGRDLADAARVAQELAIGRRIQVALLPRRFPEVEGWTFAAEYEPAREVGGDLFDAFRLRDRSDSVCLVVADVTGKGIPAALLMADVRALLHAAADNAVGPADALGRVNAILVQERVTSLFVTAALVMIDVGTGHVRYASAGHEPPFVARCTGRIDRLDAAGPLLGAFGDAAFEDREDVLQPGDALVLYTDGITETRDERRRFYGEDRLLDQLGLACGMPAATIVRAVTDDLRGFRGDAEAFDDLTLLVVERRPTDGPPNA